MSKTDIEQAVGALGCNGCGCVIHLAVIALVCYAVLRLTGLL